MQRRTARKLATGLAFISPNIAGFLLFTLFPLLFSLAMAFTNWDLRMHNAFRGESVRFIGLDNFRTLYGAPDFGKYLGNTLFFMIGIPFSVAGSLGAALLLSKDLRGGSKEIWLRLVLTATLLSGTGMLVLAGLGSTAMIILIGGVAGAILILGTFGGQTTHRTLFYFPHFTAGVATFLLWKKLYNPHTGPINNALRPALSALGEAVGGMTPTMARSLGWLCVFVGPLVVLAILGRLYSWWRDGEAGRVSIVLGLSLLVLPAFAWWRWSLHRPFGLCAAGWAGLVCLLAAIGISRPRTFTCGADKGLGPALIICGSVLVLQFLLLGASNVLLRLPEMTRDGLTPPEWLTSYHWAKPALMAMGLWAAIGSNNMLLYLAGLSNIPTELYEAADMDGASRTQRFWHVTWPQLAPVTFFILVMAVIGGLQGGFEMARTMTRGGPAGATTTLSYYVYTEGFETGRLGYASAVAWTLFLLVFGATLFNWRFGNRYTND